MIRMFISLFAAFFLFGNPFILPDTGFAEAITESGSIVETMDASGYTYMLIESSGEKSWVAVPESDVKVGDKVTYLEGMIMKDFHSKTLGRTFDTIIFSSGLVQEGAPASAKKSFHAPAKKSSFAEAVKQETQQQMQQPVQQQVQGSAGSAGATVPYLEASVEKADGKNGLTIEEAFKQAEKLNGSTVRIRGKVVKFSPNIMGRNWIHIQDGTGNPMENTHDLVVTTSDVAELEEVILVEGKIIANKDFGYGYKYDTLIEEASLVK